MSAAVPPPGTPPPWWIIACYAASWTVTLVAENDFLDGHHARLHHLLIAAAILALPVTVWAWWPRTGPLAGLRIRSRQKGRSDA